jgi:hypothetical protein
MQASSFNCKLKTNINFNATSPAYCCVTIDTGKDDVRFFLDKPEEAMTLGMSIIAQATAEIEKEKRRSAQFQADLNLRLGEQPDGTFKAERMGDE